MSKKYSSMFKTVTRGMYEFSLDDKDNAIEFGFARESNSKFIPIQFNNYIYITKKKVTKVLLDCIRLFLLTLVLV